MDTIQVKTTQEYFNMTAEELQFIRYDRYTREEAKICDAAAYTHFYSCPESALADYDWYNERCIVKEILLLTDGRAAVLLEDRFED